MDIITVIFYPRGGGLAKVPWGGYIGAGYISDSTNSWFKLTLFRFDSNGDTIWTKTYTDTANLEGYFVKVARKNRYIIGSSWANYKTSNWVYTTVLTETDSSGNELWQKTYSSERYLTGIDTFIDGGFVFSEWTYDSTSNCGRVIAVTKVDSLGNQKWTQYSGNGGCNAYAGGIVSLKDGSYVVCGGWDTKSDVFPSEPSPVLYMEKISANGAAIWNKEYGIPLLYAGDAYLYMPIELANGNIVACGNGDSVIKGCILKVDSNGNQKWLRYYVMQSPNYQDYLINMQYTSDGGCVSSGFVYGSNESTWVVKVDSNGCDVVGCGDTVTGEKELIKKNEEVRVYPNPASTQITIEYTNNDNEPIPLTLYDLLGNRVEDITLPTGESSTTENVSKLATGMYVYSIQNKDNVIQRGKIIIAR